MTTDVTTLSGITRVQSNSNTVNRASAKVVPINDNVSAQLNAEKNQTTVADLKKVASKVNDFVKEIGRSLEFSVDEASGRVIITVRESETGKIVRQIPPEELLAIADLVRENFTNTSIPSGILIADKG